MATAIAAQRILFVNHTSAVSGAEISMVALIAGLREGSVLEGYVAAPGGGPLEQLCEARGVPFHPLELSPAPLTRPDKVVRNALILRRLVRRLQPAILHANSFHATKILAPYAAVSSIPLVGSVRDIIDFTPLTLRAMSSCDRVVCVSRATRDNLLRGSRVRNKDRFVVVYNGVPQARPTRNPVAGFEDKGRPIITAISPLVRWKGQGILLRAARLVARETDSGSFVIVGHDRFAEPGYVEELRSLARFPELAERVVFKGFQRDISRVLSASDIVVVPSIQPDPFPRAVIEAMAAGRAVVASRIGGIPEAFEDGVAGLLVPPGDATALARALLRLIRNPALARALGAAAAQVVRVRFSVERQVEAMTAVYRSLISLG